MSAYFRQLIAYAKTGRETCYPSYVAAGNTFQFKNAFFKVSGLIFYVKIPVRGVRGS